MTRHLTPRSVISDPDCSRHLFSLGKSQVGGWHPEDFEQNFLGESSFFAARIDMVWRMKLKPWKMTNICQKLRFWPTLSRDRALAHLSAGRRTNLSREIQIWLARLAPGIQAFSKTVNLSTNYFWFLQLYVWILLWFEYWLPTCICR